MHAQRCAVSSFRSQGEPTSINPQLDPLFPDTFFFSIPRAHGLKSVLMQGAFVYLYSCSSPHLLATCPEYTDLIAEQCAPEDSRDQCQGAPGGGPPHHPSAQPGRPAPLQLVVLPPGSTPLCPRVMVKFCTTGQPTGQHKCA